MFSLWELHIVKTDTETRVRGVLLRKTNIKSKAPTSLIGQLIRVARSYFAKRARSVRLRIVTDVGAYLTTTNSDGTFQQTIECTSPNKISITVVPGNITLKLPEGYPTYFDNSNAPFCVISDLDDTLLSSYTARFAKRILTILLKPPHKRTYIQFTTSVIGSLAKKGAPVYYVSKSESNLFGLITQTILHHKLPIGSIWLTPYLKFYELFDSKGGMHYKLNIIEDILLQHPNQTFFLFGDDTQRDIEVYANIVMQHPKQVEKIFIRKTKPTLNKAQEKAIEKIRMQSNEVHLFEPEESTEEFMNIWPKSRQV